MRADPRYPPPPPGVSRYSPSAIEAFLGCGYAFLLDRETPHRRSTIPMAIGTAISKAAKADNEHKLIATKPEDELTLSNLVEVAVTAYETETAEAEIEAGKFELARGKMDTAAAAQAYGRDVSPQVTHVVAAEHQFCAEVTPTIQLVGTPDTVTLETLRDTKTGQEWTQERANRSRQLTGYDYLHEAAYHETPKRLAIDSIHETKKGWRATTIWTRRSAEDRARFLRTVEAVDGAVRAGNFLPAPERSWKCTKRWCGHWEVCPLRPGGQ